MNIRKLAHAACRVLFLSLFPFLFTNFAFAETKTFIKEYTYQASEYDSKVSCRVLALEQAKRLLLEELGTYLESETEIKNFHLSKDQIVTYTAGSVATEVIAEKWDGKVYWIKVIMSADSDLVAKSIDELRYDKQKTKELEGIRKISDVLVKDNARLQNELKKANEKNIEKKKREYNENIRQISAMERWSYYASNMAGYNFYYDTKTIDKLSNRSIKVWTKTVSPYKGEVAKSGLDLLQDDIKITTASWKTLLEINCENRIYRSLEMVTKDFYDISPSAWSHFTPESYNEVLYDIFCTPSYLEFVSEADFDPGPKNKKKKLKPARRNK